MDTADRIYVEALIGQAMRATRVAQEVAALHRLADIHERLTWALDFQEDARRKLQPDTRNFDGTTGPEHVTDEGVELDPPEG